jgi:hypothetical protein
MTKGLETRLKNLQGKKAQGNPLNSRDKLWLKKLEAAKAQEANTLPQARAQNLPQPQ